jgi:dihydrofolate reductase
VLGTFVLSLKDNTMRKLILKMSVSVDGFVGGPNGEIDWIFKSMDDAAAEWTVNNIWQAGLHIMGSRTFHDMSSYWPHSTEVFAAPMNEIPKAVFTRRGNVGVAKAEETTTALKNATALNRLERTEATKAKEESWINATVISGDLIEEINKLKQQPGKDIIAHGGGNFAQSLVQAGVIDEYKLLVHPVVLGKGLPLFGTLDKPTHLQLLSSTSFRSGVIAKVFRPVAD